MKTLLGALLLAASSASAWAAGTPCEGLTKMSLPHAEVTASTVVAKGAFTPPPGSMGGGGGGNNPYAALPSFCRVQITSRPSSDSDIKIEVWLPVAGWNGRLQALGNGAFMGSIFYGNMAQALAEGYAAVGTDTGHPGSSGDFAYGHPEKLIDWGYRSVHEMTVDAKAVIAAHYGTPAKYAYWNSCSTGGREGLIEAEYYPNDFDGLAVGDAANPMTRNQASTLYDTLAVNQTPESFISKEKWLAYHKAALDKCDAADGVKDGLLSDPLSCKFDPSEMLCKAGDSNDCLTAPQVAAMQKVLAGMKNPRTGEQLHPGWPVGATPNSNSVVGHEPEGVAVETFRALFNDPTWDYHTMDFDKDIARADKLGAHLTDAADEAKLQALFAHGGKLFMYHGWSDGNITPLKAIDYYTKAVAANGGPGKTSNEIRLFMVPGMGHCQGGEGPNEFSRMDVIVDWVEKGKAPDMIVAAHSTKGVVDRTRPLCPYPQVAKYKGTGSTDEAQNFACVAP